MSKESSIGGGQHSRQYGRLKWKGNLLPWLHPEHQGLRAGRTSGKSSGLFYLFYGSACKDLNTAEHVEIYLKESVCQKLTEFCLF